MSKHDIKTPDNNPFLSRGCSRVPHPGKNNKQIYKKGCCKMDEYDWLKDIRLPNAEPKFNYAEVRFKNNRKDFFKIPKELNLATGDFVAVEVNSGHDIGIVSLLGETARLQMKRRKINPTKEEVKKIYRKARPVDIEKWITAVMLEDKAILKTRKIARNLQLEMKINDVEYQGDQTRAVFYYTADERVDFREMIKILAEEFNVKVEMKQIGIRQEAARIGGIGSCGREICCASWLCNFKSVPTHYARSQNLSLNPQKLAGQCSKLKCCLNYEYDHYVESLKDFPDSAIILKTKKGDALHQKNDVFKKLMWYSYCNDPANIIAIPLKKVKHIIEKNKKNILPEKLEDYAITEEKKNDFETKNEPEAITRFDNLEHKKTF